MDCLGRFLKASQYREIMLTDCSSVNTNQSQNINKHFKLIRLHMFIGLETATKVEVILHIKEQNPVDRCFSRPRNYNLRKSSYILLCSQLTRHYNNITFSRENTPLIYVTQSRFIRFSTHKLFPRSIVLRISAQSALRNSDKQR